MVAYPLTKLEALCGKIVLRPFRRPLECPGTADMGTVFSTGIIGP